jgi:hypothetical protein
MHGRTDGANACGIPETCVEGRQSFLKLLWIQLPDVTMCVNNGRILCAGVAPARVTCACVNLETLSIINDHKNCCPNRSADSIARD